MGQVIDSSALIRFLDRAQGHEIVTHALSEASAQNKPIQIASINWGEVYYSLINKNGLSQANAIMTVVEKMPLEIINCDIHVTKIAAQMKAEFKLPYADTFAAALAKLNKATLITADQDFRVIQKEINILWI